jgi:hypothetical protein
MLVTNTGGRSAARFTANAGITPFSVSNSTKIGSLNSDLLDGLDSSAFLRTSGKAADANLLDGIDSTGFYAAGSKVADSELLDGYDANQLARAARGSNENDLSLFPSTPRATFVLTAPKSGFAFVSGWVSASSGDSTNCTPCYLHMRLRDVTGAAKSPDNVGEVNTAGDGFGGTSMAMSWVFPVAAGQRTFSLDADPCSPGCPNINSSVFFANATLTALYVPFGSAGAGTLGAAPPRQPAAGSEARGQRSPAA